MNRDEMFEKLYETFEEIEGLREEIIFFEKQINETLEQIRLLEKQMYSKTEDLQSEFNKIKLLNILLEDSQS
ncbi:MAG: hypothetical protein FWC41_00080 [Firmicutes bacterium]|nr:hypothetical protein [Bacillota bacterium]